MTAVAIDPVGEILKFHREYDAMEHPYSDEKLIKIIETLLDKGRYVMCWNGDELLGYIESLRIDYAQFGWIVCHPKDFPNVEAWDVQTGNICYLANIVIHPKHRHSEVMTYLKNEFYKQNYACEFFVGESRRKKHQPVSVFTRQEFWNKYKSEVANG